MPWSFFFLVNTNCSNKVIEEIYSIFASWNWPQVASLYFSLQKITRMRVSSSPGSWFPRCRRTWGRRWWCRSRRSTSRCSDCSSSPGAAAASCSDSGWCCLGRSPRPEIIKWKTMNITIIISRVAGVLDDYLVISGLFGFSSLIERDCFYGIPSS